MKTEVVVVIGAGGIGMAIARRQGFGKHILLADFNETLLAGARKQLEEASYQVSTLKVDVSSRESVRALAEKAASLGSVINVVNTAGVSPNMAPPERVLAVDLYGSAVVFEEFERVIAEGGSGLIVSSMAGHMMPSLPKEQNQACIHTCRRASEAAVPRSGCCAEFDDRLHHVQACESSAGAGFQYQLGQARRSRELHQSWNRSDSASTS